MMTEEGNTEGDVVSVPMKKSIIEKEALVYNNKSSTKGSSKSSTSSSSKKVHQSIVGVGNVGFPGFLTEHEYQVFEKFRDEVWRRDEAFRSTVFCFQAADEEESYALCRWLRARKYDLSATIQMVQEATECRSEAASNNFYPDPHRALGVPESVYISQYPQTYFGRSKTGCPLFFSRPGSLQVHGLECITTFDGVFRYHWYAMMHDFVRRLHAESKRNPTGFKRYEIVCVMDLKHLTATKITKKALHIVQIQSQIDSLCFPETLSRMIVINAPSFFTMTWRVIKNWIDPRTAAKVDILGTTRSKWELKLKELIDIQFLPSDYGGSGPTFEQILQNVNNDDANLLMTTHPQQKQQQQQQQLQQQQWQSLYYAVRPSGVNSISIPANCTATLSVYTRSLSGGYLTILSKGQEKKNNNKNKNNNNRVMVQHKGKGIDEEEPTKIDLANNKNFTLQGPNIFHIHIESKAGSFHTDYFVVVANIVATTTTTTKDDDSMVKRKKDIIAPKQEKDNPTTAVVDAEASSSSVLMDVPLYSNEEEKKETDIPVLPVQEPVVLSSSSNPPPVVTNVVSPVEQDRSTEKQQQQQLNLEKEERKQKNNISETISSSSSPDEIMIKEENEVEETYSPSTGCFCGIDDSLSFSSFINTLCGR